MTPIFLFSLPRAGSTLLQRLLLTDGRCTTVGEPSFLLRLLGDDEVIQRRATYGEGLVRSGHEDLRAAWPGFDAAYEAGVRDLALRVYQGLAGERDWFLDKTPRYHLIADRIVRLFPDAKFILLWRHPLAVAASLSSTFRRGVWSIDEHDIDLHAGMDRLHALRAAHGDRLCQIRYEDLVSQPATELARLGDYLGWPDLTAALDKPLVSGNQGRLGDPTGVKKYAGVSSASRDAWIADYRNWYRRSWARAYYASPRGALARDLGYELPAEIFSGAPGLLSGLRDWNAAAWRRRRRLSHPVAFSRFARAFHRREGYHVRFN